MSLRHALTGVASGSLLVLAGCATLGPPPIASLHPAGHLSIIELPTSVDDDSLRRNFHNKEKKVSAATLAEDRQQLQTRFDLALNQALDSAGSALLATANIVHFDDPALTDIGKPLDVAALERLQATSPADDYLRLRVTDYGQTPKSWLSAYVAFEVVSTLAIAGVLYVHKVTRPVAGIYLVQESAEELGEGYGGFWLINRLSRPVRIEADLVDGRTGQVIWHDSETGMADWHWHDVWHMNNTRRDTLLGISTDKAIADLVKELELG